MVGISSLWFRVCGVAGFEPASPLAGTLPLSYTPGARARRLRARTPSLGGADAVGGEQARGRVVLAAAPAEAGIDHDFGSDLLHVWQTRTLMLT